MPDPGTRPHPAGDEIDVQALSFGYVPAHLAHLIEETVVDGVAHIRILTDSEAAPTPAVRRG